jgi:hypothetical protein
MAETGRSFAFAGRGSFFALGGWADRASAVPDRVRVGAVKNTWSEQPSEIHTVPVVRCNLHRPWWLRSLPLGLLANCRTTLHFDAGGAANSGDLHRSANPLVVDC